MRSPPTKPTDPSRRDALRALVAAGTTAAAATLPSGCELPPRQPTRDPHSVARDKPWVPGAERYDTDEERMVHTSCAQCPAGCGVAVRVVEGRAVRIEGNRENPINQGGIGPRGMSALQALYDPDRLRGPLVRRGRSLEAITWDEAQDLLAQRLGALRQSGHPERLLVLCGLQRGFALELWARFCRAFGTPNLVDGRPSRTATLSQAMLATAGRHEIPAFEWSGARQVVSFEAGLLEDSCQAVHFARSAGARVHRDGVRTKLVHLGPSFDLSAHNADEWIQIQAGTSGTFALGICHVLLRDELVDAAEVAARTTGFDAFRQLVAPLDPDRVAAITGARARDVVRVAHELGADRQRAFGYVDDRSLSFSNGWETAVAVLGLNALLGAVGRRSGGLLAAPDAPFAEWPAVEPDEVARAGLATPRIDRAGSSEFPLARSVLETLPSALSRHRPEVVLLHHSNPAYARARPGKWREALARVPFVVSFSPYRDESVEEVAHLVLPDHSFLERWEDAMPAPAIERAVAGVRRPVVATLHDTKQTGDVLLAVARRLDEPVARAFPWRSFRSAIEARFAGLHAANRGSIVAPTEHAFLQKLYERGFWVDDPPSDVPEMEFRFVAAHAEPAWDGAEGDYPLRLLVYRPLGHAEGGGVNQPFLRFLRSRPDSSYWSTPCTVHPDAVPAELEDGALLVVTSPWGSITAPLRRDPRMRPGHAAIPAGGGHTAFGRWARGYGVNALELLGPEPARHTGASLLCSTRVRVKPAREEA